MTKHGMYPGQGDSERHLWGLLIKKHLIQRKTSIQAEFFSHDIVISEYGADGHGSHPLLSLIVKVIRRQQNRDGRTTDGSIDALGWLHQSQERMKVQPTGQNWETLRTQVSKLRILTI